MGEVDRKNELLLKADCVLQEYADRKKKSINEHSIFCAYGLVKIIHKKYNVEQPKGYVTKKSIRFFEEYIILIENNIVKDKKKAVEALQAIADAREYLSLVTSGRIRGGI